MNTVRSIQALNARELEAGTAPEASWHRDFADTAYIFIGGLPFDLSEGDIITIFSQYGEPTHVHLARDKETGKSRGFAFLKYEDQRSTDIAVDNLGGAQIMGRTLRVDHTRYNKKEGQDEDEGKIEKFVVTKSEDEASAESEEERPMLKEEIELAKMINNHEDDEDPMKAYRLEQKREEVQAALQKLTTKNDSRNGHRHKYRHRSKRDKIADSGDNPKHTRHRSRRERSRSLDNDQERRHQPNSRRGDYGQSENERDGRRRPLTRRDKKTDTGNGRDTRRHEDRDGYASSEDDRDRYRRRRQSSESR
ncbi:hypothetical protein EV356DRAFT_571031 [Viridothelium virens]|uniref:RRM domain-containing protein n=1 Tax=Viridothelium virens TaxID=1048519 RepID=A0A6A6GV27_VIRVR|nr:hypothetical protein EV356DRAFT_571031 [Viridothelium virens]